MHRGDKLRGGAERALGRLAAVILLAGACALAPIPVQAQAAPYCAEGEAPHVASIFQALVDHYGDAVGDPVECAHPAPPSGDTQQQTTTGLLYLRVGTDTPVFTDGQAHYAWTARGAIGWESLPPFPEARDAGIHADPAGELALADAGAEAQRPQLRGQVAGRSEQALVEWWRR